MRKQIKLRAKQCFGNQRGIARLTYFIYMLIIGAVGAVVGYVSSLGGGISAAINHGNFYGIIVQGIMFGGLVSTAVSIFAFLNLGVGYCGSFLRIWQQREITLGDMFTIGFVPYWKKLGAMALSSLYIALWSMLFVIPGIIKTFSYAMVPYILVEMPSVGASEAIDLSKRMMRGYKWKLFVLNLSFIGWDLLNAFTFGILGILFVEPYKATANAGFYEMVRDNALANGIIRVEGDTDTNSI